MRRFFENIGGVLSGACRAGVDSAIGGTRLAADAVVQLTWPGDCPACGEPTLETGFCPDCEALVEPRDGPRCARCDQDLPTEGPAHWCGRCLRRAPRFERAYGVYDYSGPIGDALRSGKYGRREGPVALVARRLAAALPVALLDDAPDLVVPMALHPRRVALRGYSPPLILAHAVAGALGCPCRRRVLRRIRDTPPQAGLDETQRQRNVRDAFVSRAMWGADVLLVDDVLTTGATAAAASRALLAAGADRVRILVAAQVG